MFNTLRQLLIFSALAVTIAAGRADAQPSPAAELNAKLETVRATVASEKERLSPEQMDKRLKDIIGPMFDFEEMSRSSVGAYWDKGTPEEQHEFTEVFSDLLARTYLKRIKQQVENTQVQSMTEKVEGDKARVFSKILADGQSIATECKMQLEGSEWKIYDVKIEGVGLIANYRNEFPGIIRQEGFKGLIARLKAKKQAPPAQ